MVAWPRSGTVGRAVNQLASQGLVPTGGYWGLFTAAVATADRFPPTGLRAYVLPPLCRAAGVELTSPEGRQASVHH